MTTHDLSVTSRELYQYATTTDSAQWAADEEFCEKKEKGKIDLFFNCCASAPHILA